jgi:hypothetical protein
LLALQGARTVVLRRESNHQHDGREFKERQRNGNGLRWPLVDLPVLDTFKATQPSTDQPTDQPHDFTFISGTV